MKSRLPFHPVIFALHPVLALYAGNIAEATLSEAVIPAIFTLGLTLLVFSLGQLFLKNSLKAALIASGFSVFCFSFFGIYLSVRHWPLRLLSSDMSLGVEEFLTIWALLLGCFIYVIAKSRFNLALLNQIFNVAALFVIGVTLVSIVGYETRNRVDWAGLERERLAKRLPMPVPGTDRKPDIYYIIMDRYAGPSTLRTTYGFENKDFLSYLEAKGFYVAGDSAANYPTTRQSLASSLNFEYLDFLLDHVESKGSNRIPFNELLQDHRVGRFLQGLGYQYIHMGSWFEATRKNRLADQSIVLRRLPEMFYAFYGTTMFYPLSAKLRFMELRYDYWKLAQKQFAQLSAIAAVKGPKFVFAHFLLPHEPYVFDRFGRYVAADEEQIRRRESNYIEQLMFVNQMLRQIIDRVLATRANPSIILLQSDEGTWPERYDRDPVKFNWLTATDLELEQKMKILNAYFLPGVEKTRLYPSISPVNSFRVVFNSYFGTALGLLPDESYVFSDIGHPYQWARVTEKLRRLTVSTE
jgi:hypothetical protein